jgi:hypothetical protein
VKTKIITLESHDDLISVRDKLSWAKTPRILLVWPKYEKVTLRLLDLKVLQRHADSLGAQLGLVTRRANVRRDAEALGMPVFNSTVSAQKDLWPAPAPRTQRTPPPPRRDLRAMRNEVYEKEPAWRTSLLGRVVTFTAGVTAILVLAGLFVPRAAVVVHPETRTESIVIPVSASPAFESVSITGNIPAQKISVKVEVEQSKAATGQVSIPQNKARGVAQFKNLTTDEVNIPAGTVVSATPSIRFVTLNDARLPAGVDEIIEVRIEALEAGSAGNVDVDAINSVEGALGLSMTVSNPEATTGGTDTKATGANDVDRERLRTSVLQEVQRLAEEQIRFQINADDLLLIESLEITQILSEEYLPKEGDAGKTLTLQIQAEVSTRYISAVDLAQLASSAMTAVIPQGFSPQGGMSFQPLTQPVIDSSGITYFDLGVSQTVIRNLDILAVLSTIRGQTVEQVQNELQTMFDLREEPQITITPAWWRYLPLIPFNISVEVN